jgi:hypothetical protein
VSLSSSVAHLTCIPHTCLESAFRKCRYAPLRQEQWHCAVCQLPLLVYCPEGTEYCLFAVSGTEDNVGTKLTLLAAQNLAKAVTNCFASQNNRNVHKDPT